MITLEQWTNNAHDQEDNQLGKKLIIPVRREGGQGKGVGSEETKAKGRKRKEISPLMAMIVPIPAFLALPPAPKGHSRNCYFCDSTRKKSWGKIYR